MVSGVATYQNLHGLRRPNYPMLSCDNCGDPRLNGTPVTKTGDNYRVGRLDGYIMFCCRSCAKDLTA